VAKFEGFPVINNICPHTNPELLLVWGLEYAMRIVDAMNTIL
jgi:hypothetical protein